MGKVTFRGGFRVYDGKDLTADKTLTELIPKGDAVYPLLQHIGVPAKPVVTVGETVRVGQRIAEANGVVSAHIVSGVSGTVKAIEERLTASGVLCEAIVIENDGEFTTVDGLGEKRDDTALSKEEIRQLVREAGLVGMGGIGFPTHVKLTPKGEDSIKYVIVNGTECEPYLTADECLMRENGARLIDGLKIILRLFENAKGMVVVSEDKKDIIRALSDAVKEDERITIKKVKSRYPQGAERRIIKAVTGRKMNSSMLPADVGCVVHNAETVLAIYRAVEENMPLISRVVTVTGDGVEAPQNFLVRIGTSFEEVLEAAGGVKGNPELFVAGGPMRGTAISELSVPVTKTTSALVVFASNEGEKLPVSPCIRCGRCVSVCPALLMPQKLMKFAEKSDKEGFLRYNGMECCECGSCSYICPAGQPLTQNIRQMRRSILDERRKR